mmetsp:Transcript_17206/g.66962  ORF Transcript_17206/g.66962 Transcript_17206/m.66962 type:complete len:244 (+) Transcript_17206:470-1201(+)
MWTSMLARAASQYQACSLQYQSTVRSMWRRASRQARQSRSSTARLPQAATRTATSSRLWPLQSTSAVAWMHPPSLLILACSSTHAGGWTEKDLSFYCTRLGHSRQTSYWSSTTSASTVISKATSGPRMSSWSSFPSQEELSRGRLPSVVGRGPTPSSSTSTGHLATCARRTPSSSSPTSSSTASPPALAPLPPRCLLDFRTPMTLLAWRRCHQAASLSTRCLVSATARQRTTFSGQTSPASSL